MARSCSADASQNNSFFSFSAASLSFQLGSVIIQSRGLLSKAVGTYSIFSKAVGIPLIVRRYGILLMRLEQAAMCCASKLCVSSLIGPFSCFSSGVICFLCIYLHYHGQCSTYNPELSEIALFLESAILYPFQFSVIP